MPENARLTVVENMYSRSVFLISVQGGILRDALDESAHDYCRFCGVLSLTQFLLPLLQRTACRSRVCIEIISQFQGSVNDGQCLAARNDV